MKFLSDEPFDWDNMDESKIDYGTQGFELFEMDLSNGIRWEEINSLGENALFWGDNASISVDASKFPGIRANYIYYTGDCWEAFKARRR